MIAAIRQIARMTTTATQPPAAMAAIRLFTIAMVAFTTAAAALARAFAVNADLKLQEKGEGIL